jgi:hypothetical protein
LQEQILSAQQEQAALLERVRELEKQMADLETWETEKQRYELKTVYPGGLARVMKSGMENGEPPHWLCANCYENRKKSYLQTSESRGGGPIAVWRCPAFNSSIRVRYDIYPEKPFREGHFNAWP